MLLGPPSEDLKTWLQTETLWLGHRAPKLTEIVEPDFLLVHHYFATIPCHSTSSVMTDAGLQTSRSQTQQIRSSKIPALQIHSFLRMTRPELLSQNSSKQLVYILAPRKLVDLLSILLHWLVLLCLAFFLTVDSSYYWCRQLKPHHSIIPALSPSWWRKIAFWETKGNRLLKIKR